MNLLHATTSHHQERRAANSNDASGAGRSSALAVPGDPLDSIMQCVDSGGWFDEFFDYGMDVRMSACPGGAELMDMLTDLPFPDTTESGLPPEATETATVTQGEAAAVPKPSPLSVSTSEDMDEDDEHWVSSSDESSSDDNADDQWLPSKFRKRSRLQWQQQQRTGRRKQRAESVELQVPHGDGVDRSCRQCGTVETPLWRAGPEGPKTLCNACGLRYKNKMAAPATMRRSTAKPGRR